jgi:hypothetical protein
MKIGIIGPSEVLDRKRISELAGIVAESGSEIVATPDIDSSSELFAKEYKKKGGKGVWEVVPLDDEEFGYDYLNTELGKKINCGTWRNQPEKLNEETQALICIGYSSGVLIEIGYTKWFNPKPVYIIKEMVSEKFPKEINQRLDLRYISISDLKKELE